MCKRVHFVQRKQQESIMHIAITAAGLSKGNFKVAFEMKKVAFELKYAIDRSMTTRKSEFFIYINNIQII